MSWPPYGLQNILIMALCCGLGILVFPFMAFVRGRKFRRLKAELKKQGQILTKVESTIPLTRHWRSRLT